MKLLNSIEINMVTGQGSTATQLNETQTFPSSLMKTLKRDALYCSVGMSLLLSPAGLSIATAGLAAGFVLGLGVGYVEWVLFN